MGFLNCDRLNIAKVKPPIDFTVASGRNLQQMVGPAEEPDELPGDAERNAVGDRRDQPQDAEGRDREHQSGGREEPPDE